MYALSELSNIRYIKLIIHSCLMMIVLTVLSLFIADIVSLISGSPFEINEGFIHFSIFLWIFFSIQNERYVKR